MQVFKNKNFTTRNYECTNIAACVAETAPNDNYIAADESILKNMMHVYTQNGVQYWGWL